MAHVEGKGVVAPARIRQVINNHDIAVLAQAARQRAGKYRNSRSAWKAGNAGTLQVASVGHVTQEETPHLCGLVGEWAACLYLHQCGFMQYPDLQQRGLGDSGWDLRVHDVKIEVKTRISERRDSYVRHSDARKVYALTAHAYLFAQWKPGSSDVYLLGWCWRRTITKQPVRPSRKRDREWKNYEVADASLSAMNALPAFLQARAQCH